MPAKVRRELAARAPGSPLPPLSPTALVAVLEDLRSVHNVGSIFRSCDAFAVELVVLAGLTPTPEHPRLARTALGAERTVRWVWRLDAASALAELRGRGIASVALESSPTADVLGEADLPLPVALVVGNEVAGVSSPVLEAADRQLAIPMRGAKTSLNAAVAFGIAAFTLRSRPAR